MLFFSCLSQGPLPGEQQWLERVDLVRHQWLRRGRYGTAERVGQLFDGGQRGKEPGGVHASYGMSWEPFEENRRVGSG